LGAFLPFPGSAFMTGQALFVDGGCTAGDVHPISPRPPERSYQINTGKKRRKIMKKTAVKKLFGLLLTAVLAASFLTACGSKGNPPAETSKEPAGAPAAAESAEPIVLRIGHSQGENSDWQLALEEFKKDLEARTENQIQVEIYPSDTLGNETDNITGIQQGVCEGVLSGETLANWTPYASLVSMPYAVNSLDDLIAIAGSEEVGAVIEQEIIDNAKLHPIGFFIRSARNLTSSKEVRSIEDLKGLKLRVPNNPITVSLWNAYGASATPMNWSEVFTSLQNGTLDAQENPYANIISNNIQEVQDYLIKTEHTYSWIYVLIGEDVWQSMTGEQQAAVEASAQVMMDFQHNYLKDEVANQEAQLKEEMTFIEIDKAPFIEITKKVLADQLDPEIYEIYLKMVEMNK